MEDDSGSDHNPPPPQSAPQEPDDALIARLRGFAAAMREHNPRLVSSGYGGFSFGPDDYEAIANRLQAKAPETPYCGIVEMPGDEAPETDG